MKKKKKSSLKLVCFADTHRHRPEMPTGDVLIYAGDDDIRTYSDLVEFVAWLASFPHQYKIWVAGNHDFYCETNPDDVYDLCGRVGIYYLYNTDVVIEGVKFWGSPITPRFGEWAFMEDRGADITKVWAKIPDDTDVLITHGPPLGILDRNRHDAPCGCFDLMMRAKKIQPKYHIFGHIHMWGNKIIAQEQVSFINCSVCSEDYDCTNPPVIVKYAKV